MCVCACAQAHVRKSNLSQLKGWILNSSQESEKFEISESDVNGTKH